jgi:hypothetical protein
MRMALNDSGSLGFSKKLKMSRMETSGDRNETDEPVRAHCLSVRERAARAARLPCRHREGARRS